MVSRAVPHVLLYVYDMRAVPGAKPTTVPVLLPIATYGEAEYQRPPGIKPVSTTDEVTQTEDMPVSICAKGSGLTVITLEVEAEPHDVTLV